MRTCGKGTEGPHHAPLSQAHQNAFHYLALWIPESRTLLVCSLTGECLEIEVGTQSVNPHGPGQTARNDYVTCRIAEIIQPAAAS